MVSLDLLLTALSCLRVGHEHLSGMIAEFEGLEVPFVAWNTLLVKICPCVTSDVLAAIMITLTRLHIISDAHRGVIIVRNLVNFDR